MFGGKVRKRFRGSGFVADEAAGSGGSEDEEEEEEEEGSLDGFIGEEESEDEMVSGRYLRGLEAENGRLKEEVGDLRARLEELESAQSGQLAQRSVSAPSMALSSEEGVGAGLAGPSREVLIRPPSRGVGSVSDAGSSSRVRHEYKLGFYGVDWKMVEQAPIGTKFSKDKKTELHFPHYVDDKGGRSCMVEKRLLVSVQVRLFKLETVVDPVSGKRMRLPKGTATEYDIDPEGSGAHLKLETVYATGERKGEVVQSAQLIGMRSKVYDRPPRQEMMGGGRLHWKFMFGFTSKDTQPQHCQLQLRVSPADGTFANIAPNLSIPFKVSSRKRKKKGAAGAEGAAEEGESGEEDAVSAAGGASSVGGASASGTAHVQSLASLTSLPGASQIPEGAGRAPPAAGD